MPRVERSILINAPPQTVFALIDAPERIPEFTPGVQHMGKVRQTAERIGDWFEVTYTVLGLPFPMKMHTTAYKQPEQIELHMDGGMKGSFNWYVAPHEGGSRLNLTIDYELAGGLLGRAMNALLIERMNEKNSEQLLENLKRLAEAAVSH